MSCLSNPEHPITRLGRVVGVAVLSLLFMQAAPAASTDIASFPLFTSSPTAVKPNILFVLDDSGSMASDYMPDDAPQSNSGKYGYLASQCNGLAYNPGITYTLPIDSDGISTKAAGSTSVIPQLSSLSSQTSVSQSSVSFVSVGSNTATLTASGSSTFSNGTVVTLYDTSSGDANWMTGTVANWNGTARTLTIKVTASSASVGTLSNLKLAKGSPAYFYTYAGTQSPMSYTFNGTGVDSSTTFYAECTSSVGSTPGSAVFAQVGVTRAYPKAQNYANWATYYSTRMLMMKSAVSLAFQNIDSKYRVGFTKISDKTVTSTSFINPLDFDATQRGSFYSALYAATPGSNTPLRGALSKAGRYFAKKAPSQTVDPVQYSCQRNFAILSTDGYWNTGTESNTYTSLKLDGVTGVGEQDSTAPRPMYDGGSSTVTTVDKWTVSTPTSDQIVQQPKQTQTITTQAATLTATPFQSTTTKTNALSATQGGTAVANSTITRCSSSNSCTTVTVTTASPLGLVNGDVVVIGGVTVSGNGTNSYNGTFTVSGVSGSTFTYNAGTRPTNSTNITSKGTTSKSLCPAGQSKYTQTTTKVDNAHIVKTTTYSLQTDLFTMQTETLVQTVTNHSRTVVTVNGAAYSDTGDVTGTSSSQTTHPTLPDVNVSTSTATGLTATAAQADGTLNTTTATADQGCLASPPANSTTTGAPSTTTPVVTTTTATLASPGTSNNGPAVTIAGTTAVSQSATTTTTTTVTAGGSSDSLADIAMYYYVTPLRDASLGNCTGAPIGTGAGANVCYDPNPKTGHGGVPPSGSDTAPWQHMTTFTLGLAAGSTIKYDPNYVNEQAGSTPNDFYRLTQGTLNWPTPTVSSGGGDPTNIDDLWHAAVNGRGQYFSATDPSTLASSLGTALNAIKAISGSAAAAATSTLQPVSGNNQIFLPMFTSVAWTGDLLALTINPTTGVVSTPSSTTPSAQKQLDLATPSARKVYYFKPDATGKTGSLKGVTYANLTGDAMTGNFDNFCSKTDASGTKPQQCATLAPADLATANAGSNLVSFLLGTDFTGVYRAHTHKLGDIVNGSPVYLGAPPFVYTENSYVSFAADPLGPLGSGTNTGVARPGVVYAAANDGMLHAFDGTTLDEKWAYIPSMVLPNLYKLADTAYANNHQSYVDASPTIGDIFVGGKWKSILVGGLGAGGRGYYALDVTDPDKPKALWEFTDPDLGLTFGNPIITKLKNGTWVVVFASGYNNNVNGGDGNGHLYVLDANTGALMTNAAGATLKLPTYTSGTTPAGTTTTPSGLTKINAWVDSPIDNTAKRFYGGDLLGNLWRFDVDNLVSPNGEALPLAKFQVGGVPQPITTRPELAQITANGGTRDIVLVATGEYLGTSDLSTTGQQSIYAIQDKLTAAGLGDVRAGGTLVTQTLTQTTNASSQSIRTVTSNPVDWSQKNGWMLDLLTDGERVNVDMVLQFNTLVVASNIPNDDACTAGGESWLYQLSVGTGSNISTAADKAAAVWEGASMTAGIGFVQLQSSGGATTGSGAIIRNDISGNIDTSSLSQDGGTLGKARRTSWRELAN